MNAGDIVWIEFPGAVQTKRRPAVVLSSATYHATRPDIILGLVTSQTSNATAPTDWIIQDWQPAGLRLPSAFRSYLITLPRSAVINRMGALTEADWDQVIARVKLAIHLS
jgi:mRNA interferase MazF